MAGFKKRSASSGKKEIFVGKITAIHRDKESGQTSFDVKLAATDEVISLSQLGGSKMTSFGTRARIGQGMKEDSDYGVSVGSQIITDSAYDGGKVVDGKRQLTCRGVSPNKDGDKDYVNDAKPGAMVAIVPFNGKHKDYKKDDLGNHVPIAVDGLTAKQTRILTGFAPTLQDPKAEDIRAAVVAAGEELLSSKGGYSSVNMHLVMERGDRIDISIPSLKTESFKRLLAANKDGGTRPSFSPDDYLNVEEKLAALGKKVDDILQSDAGEVFEGKLAIMPRITETMTKKSASAHAFYLKYGLSDDLCETQEDLSEHLKNQGWKFLPALVAMHNGKPSASTLDLSAKKVNLEHAIAIAAGSLMPEFDAVAYHEKWDAGKAEQEAGVSQGDAAADESADREEDHSPDAYGEPLDDVAEFGHS